LHITSEIHNYLRSVRIRFIIIAFFFALMFACSISTAYLLLGTSYTSSFSGWSYRVQDGRV
jgi:serine/threonine protein kinase